MGRGVEAVSRLQGRVFSPRPCNVELFSGGGQPTYLMIQLLLGELTLPGLRKLLHPAVVDQRYRQDSLTAHAGVGRHGVVGLRVRIFADGEKNAAHDAGVGNVPVVVWIGIEDDQVVREFARDVGVVPPPFFAPKFTPWHPALQGRTLTSSSVAVSMMVIVPVSVAAVMTYFRWGSPVSESADLHWSRIRRR